MNLWIYITLVALFVGLLIWTYFKGRHREQEIHRLQSDLAAVSEILGAVTLDLSQTRKELNDIKQTRNSL